MTPPWPPVTPAGCPGTPPTPTRWRPEPLSPPPQELLMTEPIQTSDATADASGRRGFLRAAAGAGVAATGITGFPFVHAQEKLTLRYLGTAVNQDKAIAEKFEADTGIRIQYIPVTTDDVTKRAVTSPNSFDLLDTEYFSLKKIIPTGNHARHGRQAHQERRQDHDALHQGRGRRQEGGRPGHGAEEGDVPADGGREDLQRRAHP